MNILVSNDDGQHAPGLKSLVSNLTENGHQVTVVTTRENCSGYGQALSLRREIEVEEKQPNFFVVDGTPADSVYLGLQNLVRHPVDLVVSGINNGANLADDVLYSGTFAAAMEARRCKLPSIAISITERDVAHYETACSVVNDLLPRMSELQTQHGLAVLNVNLPDVPYEELQGYEITALGKRLKAEQPELVRRNDQVATYVLGLSGEFDRSERRSELGMMFDFLAVEQNKVSISPVSSQLVQQPYFDFLQQWAGDL